jgi:shikimate kinase
MNITLIGMPGSGKTFVGAALACSLGFELLEMDVLLEQAHGMKCADIVQSHGEATFLQMQRDMIRTTVEGKNRVVISPGGAVVYDDTTMHFLKACSRVIFLRVSLLTIESRIAHSGRAIIGSNQKTLAEIFAERTPLYEKYADAVCDGEGDLEQIVQTILFLQ